MGEAKRRKEKGLAPKKAKRESSPPNLLKRFPRFPLYIGIALAIYLVFDWIKLNSAG